MPDKVGIANELVALSNRLSEQTRHISFGVLAFCWAFIVEGQIINTISVLPSVILASASILFDFLQYLVGVLYNLLLLRQMERDSLNQISYDSTHPLYRLRQAMFVLKIALTIAATGWLGNVLVLSFL